MSATLTTLDAILKVYYDKKVIPQLNEKFTVLSKFKKTASSWSGKNCTVPCHVGRNSGRGNLSSGGALPTAGTQSYVDLVLSAKSSGVRISISRDAKMAARLGQKNYFLNYIQAEVDPAMDDMAAMSNQNTIYGGLCKGFINEHKVEVVTTADDAAGANHSDWEWSGLPLSLAAVDGNPFAAAVNGTPATWVRVRLFRCDTMAEIFPQTAAGAPGAAGVAAFFISGTDSANTQVEISVVVNDATNRLINTLNPATVAMAAGVSIAVHVSPTQYLDSGAANLGTIDAGASGSRATFLTGSSTVLQQTGIYTQLASPTHFGEDRTSASGTASLQGNCLTVATTGNHQREPLTKDSIQRCLDEALQVSGKEPQAAYISPRDRQILHALVYDEMRNKGGATVNAGYTGFSFGTVSEWQADQHVGRSQIILLDFKDDVWSLFQYGDADMVRDGKGNSIFPSMTSAADEMSVEWYYDVMCKRPNSQVHLSGYSL
jgi:hypothetical protein